ncbi:hypothetical protein Ancab_023077 [Ancistrocladus abbreviatus]
MKITGLHFLGVIDGVRGVEELVEFSVSLNDWLRLDAGHFGDGDDIDEYKLRVVAARHANSCLLNTRKLARDKSWENSLWRCGLFPNNLVVVFMLQIRNPLANCGPVGAPKL